MRNLLLIPVIFCITILYSCSKDDDSQDENNNSNNNQPHGSMVFGSLIFNPTNAFFSTNGSLTETVDADSAKKIIETIDITFIYIPWDEDEPGFFDPVARSQEYGFGWNQYRLSWLSEGVETRFYKTLLTMDDFNAAKWDESLIASYFSDTTFVLAPHEEYPTGSCIGGRQSGNTIPLNKGKVIGFKNTSSGKRGLIMISYNQSVGWPLPMIDQNTKVEIIKEN